MAIEKQDRRYCKAWVFDFLQWSQDSAIRFFRKIVGYYNHLNRQEFTDMKFKYLIPLIVFQIPTIICSALMWPPEAAQPHLIGGYAVMLVSVTFTYVKGIRIVMHDQQQGGQ
jgi:hypothetical protein